MASAAGFKQQCPSCEALVPIRDPDLIGRKIDCPKCKYRFVVEDPADADADEAPKKKSAEKTGKKPVKAAKGKRRPDDEDDDRPSGAKGGGSNKLLIGGLVGGVALVALIITGYFLFFSDDGSSTKSGSSVASTPPPKPSTPDEDEKKPVVEEKPAAVASADMITNLLPPDTEGVCAVRLHNFVQNPVGHAVFGAPGTFLVGGLQRNLGFNPADVDLFLQGWNFTSNWTINILHSTKPFDKAAILAALKLKAADAKIQEQEYFVAEANPWLDALGRAAFSKLVQTSPSRLTVRSGKVGARFYDDQTLVLADIVPLQACLNAKFSFEYRKAVKVEEKKEEKDTEAEAAAKASAANVNSKREKMNLSVSGAMTMGGGDGAAGANGAQGAAKADAKPADSEPKETGAFMTIAPNLKSMLDRLDAKKPMLALAVESEPAKGRVAALSTDPVGFDVIVKEAQVVGAAIYWKDHLTFLMEGDYGSEDGARRRLRDLNKQAGKNLAEKMGKKLGTTVEYLDDEDGNDPFGDGAPSGRGGMMPGSGAPPGAGGMGRMGGGKGMPGMAGGPGMGSGVPPGGRGGRAGGGMAPGGMGMAEGNLTPPGGGRGFGGAPGFGGLNQNTPPEPPKEPAKATAKASIQDGTVVMLTVDLIDSEVYGNLLNKILRPAMIQDKGTLDMSGGRNRVHELAAASQKMVEQNARTFPRAALERPIPSVRAGRPYSPNQRISWMAELLPYIGHAPLYAQLNRSQSWQDADNIGAASTLIPQFLNVSTTPQSWWVKYPGIADPVAATQYVGIAGVGLDAASYQANDPAVADKIGILGYDRQINLRDITDGASNTMLMAQVPPSQWRPWLAGGGSTVVGVPEKNSVKPFVSTQGDGKKGTLVVMADGSVRFVSEKVSDEVFKALATIKGNESVILNKEAPKVDPPADEVTEVAALASPAPASTTPTPASVAPEEAQQKGSKEFVSNEGKFKIKFPAGKVKATTQSQNTPLGKLEIHIAALDKGNDQGCSVLYLDFPATLPAGGTDLILESVKSQIAAQIPGSKVTNEKKVKVGGQDGVELYLEGQGKIDTRVLILLANKRMYQVSIRGPKDTIEGEEGNSYLDSFKLVK